MVIRVVGPQAVWHQNLEPLPPTAPQLDHDAGFFFYPNQMANNTFDSLSPEVETEPGSVPHHPVAAGNSHINNAGLNGNEGGGFQARMHSTDPSSFVTSQTGAEHHSGPPLAPGGYFEEYTARQQWQQPMQPIATAMQMQVQMQMQMPFGPYGSQWHSSLPGPMAAPQHHPMNLGHHFDPQSACPEDASSPYGIDTQHALGLDGISLSLDMSDYSIDHTGSNSNNNNNNSANLAQPISPNSSFGSFSSSAGVTGDAFQHTMIMQDRDDGFDASGVWYVSPSNSAPDPFGSGFALQHEAWDPRAAAAQPAGEAVSPSLLRLEQSPSPPPRSSSTESIPFLGAGSSSGTRSRRNSTGSEDNRVGSNFGSNGGSSAHRLPATRATTTTIRKTTTGPRPIKAAQSKPRKQLPNKKPPIPQLRPLLSNRALAPSPSSSAPTSTRHPPPRKLPRLAKKPAKPSSPLPQPPPHLPPLIGRPRKDKDKDKDKSDDDDDYNDDDDDYGSSSISISDALRQQLEQRRDKDAFLLRNKFAGMTYREIRRRGGFSEAESTLRGRFRTLTKTRQQRVRKPEWTGEDLRLLEVAVHAHSEPGEIPHAVKIPWKKVADFITRNGGSYVFGGSTCHRRWDQLVAERERERESGGADASAGASASASTGGRSTRASAKSGSGSRQSGG